MGGAQSSHRYNRPRNWNPLDRWNRNEDTAASSRNTSSSTMSPATGATILMDRDTFEFDYMSQRYKSPPISPKFARSLPTLTLEIDAVALGTNPDDDECLICFNAYTAGSTLVSLPCGHTYHKDCLMQWFDRQCTCPYCRYEFPTDHPGYELGRIARMRGRLPRDYTVSSLLRPSGWMRAPKTKSEPSLSSSKPSKGKHRQTLVDVLTKRQDEALTKDARALVLQRLSFCESLAPRCQCTFSKSNPGASQSAPCLTTVC